MGSGVKVQGVGAVLESRVPEPSFSIRGCRRSDAIRCDPVTGLDSADGAVVLLANVALGSQSAHLRRGLCLVRPAATEART